MAEILFAAEVDMPPGYGELITQCVQATLAHEKIDIPVAVSFTATDNDGIRGINREQRDIDKPTDVLSFPMLEFSVPSVIEYDEADLFEGVLQLGDIVLSMQQAQLQSEEYEHSLQREIAFLCVHSMLHLLGYDHIDPKDEQLMRQKQREILDTLHMTRERA